jgi:hypothetical protein
MGRREYKATSTRQRVQGNEYKAKKEYKADMVNRKLGGKRVRREADVSVSCCCRLHTALRSTPHVDVEDLLEGFEKAGERDDAIRSVLTPACGWDLVAVRDLPSGTLLPPAACNLKFERDDSVSCTTAYEVTARISPGALNMRGRLAKVQWEAPLLCPLRDQHLRYANLPTPPPSMLKADDDALSRFVEENHNASLVVVTDWPYVAAVTCRPIRQGETIKMHYGPGSVTTLRKSMHEARSD